MPGLLLTAHRGLSAAQPEQTLAAYTAAIAWAGATRIPLGLECDVHFAADDRLVCLHDLTLRRVSGRADRAIDLTVAQLKRVDVGSWRVRRPTPAQRAIPTLAELVALVVAARTAGVPVGLVVETKHPNPRGGDVETAVAAELAAVGWDAPGAPVRLMSFAPEGVERLGRLLPGLPRTLLLERELGPWADGRLPEGVEALGVDVALLRRHPELVRRVRSHGGAVHAWTVNDADEARWCADHGVTGITTDDPSAVVAALGAARFAVGG